jgi:hypothetical protein
MTIDRLRSRFRKRLAGIAGFCSRLIGTIKPTTQHFGSQRMCPFCNLITPRSRRSCLECGKAFGSA